MAQRLYPTSTDDAGSFYNNESPATQANLHTYVDGAPIDTGTSITNLPFTNGSDTVEFSLSSGTDPDDHTNHTLKISAADYTEYGAPMVDSTLTAHVYQGSTLIGTPISGAAINTISSISTIEGTLSTAEAANITDYTDLKVFIESSGGSWEYLIITDVNLYIPDASGGSAAVGKVNSVANASIGEINGVAAIDISSINGVTF
jgi:hypothetical protein